MDIQNIKTKKEVKIFLEAIKKSKRKSKGNQKQNKIFYKVLAKDEIRDFFKTSE